jgi:hypothetical protein
VIPTAPEILLGTFRALMEPPPPEAMGAFETGKIGVIAMISFLVAQEAERGVAMRVAENRTIRALFAEAAEGGWSPALTGRLAALARGEDTDLTITALDRNNAELAAALIALHMAVEAAQDPARERRILRLLRDGAAARLLELPAG